jgi:hypothetical protein
LVKAAYGPLCCAGRQGVDPAQYLVAASQGLRIAANGSLPVGQPSFKPPALPCEQDKRVLKGKGPERHWGQAYIIYKFVNGNF